MEDIQPQVQNPEQRHLSKFGAIIISVITYLPTLVLFYWYQQFFSYGGVQSFFDSFNITGIIGILLFCFLVILIPYLLLRWTFKNFRQKNNVLFTVALILIVFWLLVGSLCFAKIRSFTQNDPGYDPSTLAGEEVIF